MAFLSTSLLTSGMSYINRYYWHTVYNRDWIDTLHQKSLCTTQPYSLCSPLYHVHVMLTVMPCPGKTIQWFETSMGLFITAKHNCPMYMKTLEITMEIALAIPDWNAYPVRDVTFFSGLLFNKNKTHYNDFLTPQIFYFVTIYDSSSCFRNWWYGGLLEFYTTERLAQPDFFYFMHLYPGDVKEPSLKNQLSVFFLVPSVPVLNAPGLTSDNQVLMITKTQSHSNHPVCKLLSLTLLYNIHQYLFILAVIWTTNRCPTKINPWTSGFS